MAPTASAMRPLSHSRTRHGSIDPGSHCADPRRASTTARPYQLAIIVCWQRNTGLSPAEDAGRHAELSPGLLTIT
jgi:hypothetical protein